MKRVMASNNNYHNDYAYAIDYRVGKLQIELGKSLDILQKVDDNIMEYDFLDNNIEPDYEY